MAELSARAKNDLPDSAFAIVLPGGRKDGSGRTVPRSLRKFPIRRRNGDPDPARIRNALSRIGQAKTKLSSSQRARARARIRAAAIKAGIGAPAEKAGK